MAPVALSDLLSVALRLGYDIPEEHRTDYQRLTGQLVDAAENVMKQGGECLVHKPPACLRRPDNQ